MDADQLSVLVLGNIERTEMRRVAEALVADSPDLRIVRLEGIDAATEHVRQGRSFPDLVVVCQSWPDEFPRPQVDQLLGLLPLAHCICCFGAWCEGDGRSRETWPIALRTSARCAQSRIHNLLSALRNNTTPPGFTASRDEAFEFDRPPVAPVQVGDVSVHVVCQDRPLRNLWEDVLAQAGCHVDSSDETQDVIVYDVDPRLESSTQPLRDLIARNPESRVVALAGLAHPKDVDLLVRCGVSSVLTKLDSNQALVDAVLSASTHS
ncbi:MAG: hypothetical protein CMJ48_15010 [Planctomycetaceae bacterium]|nr:hypothetical protein [Planctomycetaceae bacterium]